MSLLDRIKTVFATSLKPDQVDWLTKQIDAFDQMVESLPQQYTTRSNSTLLIESWQQTAQKVRRISVPKRNELYPRVQRFLNDCGALKDTITTANAAYMTEELKRCRDLLSNIDGKALDAQQREVVVCAEDRNLVIAGAGSGKTLTISGKVKYLCDVKGIAPEDILLIAFTRKSAQEMSDRIQGKLGLPVQATTFHKLGLDIITDAVKQRPDVLDDLTDFVTHFFEQHFQDNHDLVRNLLMFFGYYMNIPADIEQYGSLGEAYEAEKWADLETLRNKYERSLYLAEAREGREEKKRTLRNEQVKSLDEVNIANFLFLNGVSYEYERLYPVKGQDANKKPYRPDFYLPDYDLYLEHFGINREGKLPWLTPVEERKYQEEMNWKRQFHRQNGTKLLETYSYYASEGRLLEELEKLLRANGVELRERNFNEVFQTIYASESEKYFPQFISLCCTFITLFKSAGYQEADLEGLKSNRLNNQFMLMRTELFKAILAPILGAYQNHLEDENAIDFADMINQAAALVRDGHPIRNYRWVIVDEYQDISMARYRLVRAILEQTGAKLLCVGDDWQSIYRFAGSDINLFTQFEHFFGPSAVMRLEQTYRNSQQLIDAAGAFVMKNPRQYRKNLRSGKRLDYPITFLCYEENPYPLLRTAINKCIQTTGVNASILLLGRTGYDFELIQSSGLFQIGKNRSISYLASPDTPISFLTVHRSKGLEADNVVLLNFQNATLGFPNQIADDPLVGMVMTEDDPYRCAEERRLLYVALTRTRNRVYVLVDEQHPSEFFKEFQTSESVFILDHAKRTGTNPVFCPRCKTGHLILRMGEQGKRFVGCTNYPRCNYTIHDPSVLAEPKHCPECGGFLVKRKGKWGSFYGCSNYPECHYHEKQDQPGEKQQ